VEKTLAFQSLSQNFLPVIKTLQQEKDINSLRDLALRFNRNDLTKKIIDNKAYPEGEDPEAFAGKLYNDLFRKEPTAVLRNMVADAKASPIENAATRANVNSFLSNLPDTFDIRSTSVYEAFKYDNAFKDISPEQVEQTKEAVKSLQRVTAISPVPEAVPVLLKSNLSTAFMISEIPEKQFAQ